MKLTHEIIESGRSERGGWRAAQLQALGVPWPPQKGWKRRLIGFEITDEQHRAFLAARGTVPTVGNVPQPRRWKATVAGPDGTRFTVEACSKADLFSSLSVHFAEPGTFV